MKKLAILAIGLMLFITGCGKETEEDLISKFEKMLIMPNPTH